KKRSRLQRTNGSILGAGSRVVTGTGRASRSGASCSQPSAAASPGSCADTTGGTRRSLRKKRRADESLPSWISCNSSSRNGNGDSSDSSSSSSSEKADAKVSKPGRGSSSKQTPKKQVLNRGNSRDGASATLTAAKRRNRSCRASSGRGAAAGHSTMGKATDPAGPPANATCATRSSARQLRGSGRCASTKNGGSDDESAFDKPNKEGRSSGGQGRGGDCNRSLQPPVVDLALSADDDECLVDTDSDAGSDGSQSVLCRCGGRDSKDGSCWISCDGRGCRTWEHLRCAYPERAAAAAAEEEEDDDGGEENPPEIHFCYRCKAERSAAGVGSSGGSLLTRGGGGSAAPDPLSRSPSIGFSPSKRRMSREGSAANSSSDVEVRRSRRVMRREGIRTLLRKNVVGTGEGSGSPSCSDSADGVAGGGSDSGVRVSLGGSHINANDGDEDDSDGFWAPEGQVEASEEFRCRCGATHQEEGVIGTPNNGGSAVSGDGGGGESRWLQCRSDWCGVWEHAACCEHGCSAGAAPVVPGSPASATNRKHWCRSCDPKGKKHARWKQRLRNSSRKRKLREDGRGGRRARAGLAEPSGATGAAAGGGKPTPRRRQAVDERSKALLRRLWDAVASANVASVKQVLLEVKGDSGEESEAAQRRLLMERQPPPGGRGGDATFFDDRSRGGGGGVTACSKESANVVVSGGVNVLMLAAGHWKSVANDAGVEASADHHVGAGVAETPPATELGPGEGAAAATASTSSGFGSGPVAAAVAASTAVRREGKPEAEGEKQGSGEEAAVTSEAPVLPAEADEEPARAVVVSVDEPRQTGESADAEGGAAPAATDNVNVPPLGSGARLAVLRLLLARNGEKSVLAVDAEGRTAVHHAAEAGASREAALLLGGEVGGQASLSKSLNGLTPLHVAAAAGHAETCASMLAALAPHPRAAALAATDAASGETAFHLACVEGRADCVRAILSE
ncbi:unnamed protein product, partial [Laminaria digitata]